MGTHTEVPRLMTRERLKVLCFLGTRPEAIKVVPIVVAGREHDDVDVRVVTSGQHPKHMLEVLDHFGISTDADVRLFRKGQTLGDVHVRAMRGFGKEIAGWLPDVVVVQGDTTSALAGALSAFYAGVPVAHVEAGLRTRDLTNPYPEEMNRRLIDTFADYLFPPTAEAAANLQVEGLRGAHIFVTGNTVVDALRAVTADDRPVSHGGALIDAFKTRNGYKSRVLVTVHRRESWGAGIDAVASVIRRVAEARPDVQFLAPLHPNPTVRRSFEGELPHNLVIGDPLPYAPFVKILSASDLVVTDSGGILEEATSLGKRVIILRRCTERPEALSATGAAITGTDAADVQKAIWSELQQLGRPSHRQARDVFGDGRAGERIIGWLRWRFGLETSRPQPFAAAALRRHVITRSTVA